MLDILVWNKYSRVVMLLAEKLKVPPTKALTVFYNSPVYNTLLNKDYPLITMSDAYICDEIYSDFIERDNKLESTKE